MKKTSLLFVIIFQLFVLETYGQSNFEIHGTMDKKYNGHLVNLQCDMCANFPLQTTMVKDGNFYFNGKLTESNQLFTLNIYSDTTFNSIDFFAWPKKMTIEIQDLDNTNFHNKIIYKNVPFIKDLSEYKKFVGKEEEAVSKNRLARLLESKKYNSLKSDSLKSMTVNGNARLRKRQIEFMQQHGNNFISLHLFTRNIIDSDISFDALNKIYTKFDLKLRNSSLGKIVKAKLEERRKLSINQLMPDFSFQTDRKEKYALSDFRGKKYVLLIFWASWCKPCRENLPTLKNIFENYPSKGLQLISVSIDIYKNNWTKLLQDEKLPWLQTCDIDEFINKNLQKLYKVNYIPQYLLIDRSGKLVYRDDQENSDDDYSVLKNLLLKIFP